MSRSDKQPEPLDAFTIPIKDLKWSTPGVDKLVARMMLRGLISLNPYAETLEQMRSSKRVEAWQQKLSREEIKKSRG
jgi:hypothetical protein